MAFKAIYPAKRSSDKGSKSNNGRGGAAGAARAEPRPAQRTR